MDILQLLDDLEETVTAGWPVPGMNRSIVDSSRVGQLLDEIRAHFPAELETARTIAAERDRILREAHDEAGRVIDEAGSRAIEMVNEEGIYKTAERQAQTLIEQATVRAEEIRTKADDYVVDSLRALEMRLEQTLSTVQNGVAALESRAPKDDASNITLG